MIGHSQPRIMGWACRRGGFGLKKMARATLGWT